MLSVKPILSSKLAMIEIFSVCFVRLTASIQCVASLDYWYFKIFIFAKLSVNFGYESAPSFEFQFLRDSVQVEETF